MKSHPQYGDEITIIDKDDVLGWYSPGIGRYVGFDDKGIPLVEMADGEVRSYNPSAHPMMDAWETPEAYLQSLNEFEKHKP